MTLVNQEIMRIITKNTMAKPSDTAVLVMPKYTNTGNSVIHFYYLIECSNGTAYVESYSLEAQTIITYGLDTRLPLAGDYKDCTDYDKTIKIICIGNMDLGRRSILN